MRKVACLFVLFVSLFLGASSASAKESLCYIMDESEFSSLVSTLRSATWTNDKIAVMKNAATYNNFTAEQVSRLSRVAYDDAQSRAGLAIAIMGYAKLCDPSNTFLIYNALTFLGDKRDFQNAISNITPTPVLTEVSSSSNDNDNKRGRNKNHNRQNNHRR